MGPGRARFPAGFPGHSGSELRGRGEGRGLSKKTGRGRLQISDWVAEEAAGRTEDLIARDAIDRFTRLALASVVYFKVQWQAQFEERATSAASFYALSGSESNVEMMRQAEHFGYARGDGYQAVDLTYEGEDLSFTAVLPDEGKFEAPVDSERLGEILEGVKDGEKCTRLDNNTLDRQAIPRQPCYW